MKQTTTMGIAQNATSPGPKMPHPPLDRDGQRPPPKGDLLKRSLLVSFAILIASACSDGDDTPRPSPEPIIVTKDVDRFYTLYDETDGRPSAEELQRYIDEGSPGLKVLAERRRVTGARIAEAIEASPEIYRNARSCAAALPAATERLDEALARLFELYPQTRTPAVTIAVGRGKPVGIGYRDTGVQIGLEALCAAEFLNPDIEDRFVHVIAHEYVHVQQSEELAARVGGEAPTVLDVSLSEGVAEFIGELISGDIAYGSLRGDVAGREEEIERAFLADKDKTDLSDWVYNSAPDAPGDLGYWVGYRIAKAYYQNTDEKTQAISGMLELTDPNTFLEASGWYPGIELDR